MTKLVVSFCWVEWHFGPKSIWSSLKVSHQPNVSYDVNRKKKSVLESNALFPFSYFEIKEKNIKNVQVF